MLSVREFTYIDGEMYLIKRKLKEEDKPIVDVWKEHLRADKVFRQNGILFFCELIPQIEIVNEP